jgi:hypothetical protein
MEKAVRTEKNDAGGSYVGTKFLSYSLLHFSHGYEIKMKFLVLLFMSNARNYIFIS